MNSVNPRALSAHYFIRGIIFFAFAMYIVMLVRSDHILLYIAPRMILYVKISALGLYAAAIYQLFASYRAFKGRVDLCECEHAPSNSIVKNVIVYSLFILPLALGFLLPNQVMNSSMADKKGMNLASSSQVKANKKSEDTAQVNINPEEMPPSSQNNADPSSLASEIPNNTIPSKPTEQSKLDLLFPSDQFTEMYADYGKKLYSKSLIEVTDQSFIEILTTLDLYMNAFQGKKVTISGFVYRGDGMKSNQFAISRFAIQCCSADAAPYGMLVELPNAAQYADDAWLKLEGTLSKTKLDDIEIMKLEVSKAESIKAPKSSYVYPDFNFGT